MLLVTDFFKTFTGKPVADAHQSTEVLVALSCDSRAHVDELVARARAAGARAAQPAGSRLHVFARLRGPDGHVWELVYGAGRGAAQA